MLSSFATRPLPLPPLLGLRRSPASPSLPDVFLSAGAPLALPAGRCCLRAHRRGHHGDVLCFSLESKCALSRTDTQGLDVERLKGNELLEDKIKQEDGDHSAEVLLHGAQGLREAISGVKAMLSSMGDGEISISPYDTAWVALVKDLHGASAGGPQFPASLKWIVDNQLSDGSWGDAAIFSAHDRMINTLACVVALCSWRLCPDQCHRGLGFIRQNMWRLAEEEEELMPIGFEVAFPSLLDVAKGLGLEIPYDDPALQDIYAKRDLKLERIPRDVMHRVPTTLLHSLEGMLGLDWGMLLKLACPDGSFLFSPSSTAYGLMQTGDPKCLRYLQKVIQRFGGGVPNVYPVDMFEHIWVVDRLERLGLSRYFETEITECLDYVHRHWTPDGICWARNSPVQDVDDTAMAFRLLRLHGYDVSPGAFDHFEKDGEFFCFAGQANQAVTGMYNLNRASQVLFPGEEILQRAKEYTYRFLRHKQASNQLLDKWIITKDLPGEVKYALEFPWYASLPRVEARHYVEQYGGGSDVWIGKTLYRMPFVNNDAYLELAKTDFNLCQSLHQLEWLGLQKWYNEINLKSYGVTKRSLLEAYFIAAANVFEPDRAAERLGWARTTVVAGAIAGHLKSGSDSDSRSLFLRKLVNWDNVHLRQGRKKQRGEEGLLGLVLQLVIQLASDAMPSYRGQQQLQQQQQQQQVRHGLRQAWQEWLLTWRSGDGTGGTAMLLVRTLEICAGRWSAVASPASQAEYDRLARLTASVCSRLQSQKLQASGEWDASWSDASERGTRDERVESEMQELAKCVLHPSSNLGCRAKQAFLTVAKSFYYMAHCSPDVLDAHISKVLFQPVL